MIYMKAKEKKVIQIREKYEGNFHKGLFDGNGTWYYSDKSKLEGFWKKGKKDGKAKKIFENGDTYEITYKDGEKIDVKPLPH